MSEGTGKAFAEYVIDSAMSAACIDDELMREVDESDAFDADKFVTEAVAAFDAWVRDMVEYAVTGA